MEITRSVVLDLLPLYLAGEVSAETQSIIDQFLETDPELANMASKLASLKLSEDIPVPAIKERQMETFSEVKRQLRQRTMLWAALLAVAILSFLGLALLVYFMVVSG